jgi:hypothetical protein
MTKQEDGDLSIQACGSFDVLTGEYSFSLSGGRLLVTFDFLSRHDIEHLISCLSCMIESSEI